jgi:hypothetical protein
LYVCSIDVKIINQKEWQRATKPFNFMQHDYNVKWHAYNVKKHEYNVRIPYWDRFKFFATIRDINKISLSTKYRLRQNIAIDSNILSPAIFC